MKLKKEKENRFLGPFCDFRLLQLFTGVDRVTGIYHFALNLSTGEVSKMIYSRFDPYKCLSSRTPEKPEIRFAVVV